MAEEEEASENKSFKLMGILDVQKVPCSREAVLHGAGGSVAAGMLYFLATSRVKRSFDVGLVGFILTTLGSWYVLMTLLPVKLWFYCRIDNAKLRVQQRFIQEGIKNKIVYEGTVRDPANKHKSDTPSGPS